MSSLSLQAAPLLLGEGSGSIGKISLVFLGIGFLLSFILVQFVWRHLRRDGRDVSPEEAEANSMIICPECGNPTEKEYRFCRNCAGDTGKGYVDMVEPDDSSQSGMF